MDLLKAMKPGLDNDAIQNVFCALFYTVPLRSVCMWNMLTCYQKNTSAPYYCCNIMQFHYLLHDAKAWGWWCFFAILFKKIKPLVNVVQWQLSALVVMHVWSCRSALKPLWLPQYARLMLGFAVMAPGEACSRWLRENFCWRAASSFISQPLFIWQKHFH